MAHPQRYPKIMAQSWRPAARYNRLTLAGWSEAIPRYNDAFRAPLATGRPDRQGEARGVSLGRFE
jgi:hypothetical protein